MSDDHCPMDDPFHDPEAPGAEGEYREEQEERYNRLRFLSPQNAPDAIVLTASELIEELAINMTSLKRLLRVCPIFTEHKWTRKMGTYAQLLEIDFGAWCEHPMFDLERDGLFRQIEIDKLWKYIEEHELDRIGVPEETHSPLEATPLSNCATTPSGFDETIEADGGGFPVDGQPNPDHRAGLPTEFLNLEQKKRKVCEKARELLNQDSQKTKGGIYNDKYIQAILELSRGRPPSQDQFTDVWLKSCDAPLKFHQGRPLKIRISTLVGRLCL